MGSPSLVRGAPSAALIGGGFIGPVHVEALRRIGVDVLGVLGSSVERASQVARPLLIPRVYRDLDELLSDDRVGVVHVASPNAHHFEQAKRVLQADRHLVCEKPLATTSDETAALVALAQSRPSQAAAVNYNVRYYPICREMRERILGGSLGRVLSVTGSYVQDWLLYPEDYNWRVAADGHTNFRAVADIGTHWMDLAQYVIGLPIRSVCADVATFHRRRFRPHRPSDTFSGSGTVDHSRALAEVEVTTDDHAAVMLRFDGSVHGAFHVSQVTAGRKNRLTIEIAATGGALFLTASRRTSSGSARGAHPTRCSSATRVFSARPPRPCATFRVGTPRDFPTHSSSSISTSTPGSPRDERRVVRRPSRAWPTAIEKFGSARRSPGAPRPETGSHSVVIARYANRLLIAVLSPSESASHEDRLCFCDTA